jgi:DNA helicase-2/ATP-dependent DNA helicase PcrA
LRLKRHADKVDFSQKLQGLLDVRAAGNVGEVVDYVFGHELLGKSNSIRRTEERAVSEEDERSEQTRQFLDALRAVPYREVIAFSDFRETQTPFATQHGVKGAEFPNVIVAIDDSSWTQYNMGNLLAGADTSSSRLERSRNLLYVCCSRPRQGLAVVFLSTPPPRALETARDWFGAENTF